MSQNDELFRRALPLIPGGVNSPVRAFRAVGGTPVFVERAKGCTLRGVDGREYLDYVGSWGATIAGHSRPEVVDALKAACERGTSYGIPCPAEVELAEEVVRRVPSVEMVRFVNSGTEATLAALRLARAATGRDVVVKFAGCYHGSADPFLVQAGSGVATLGLPDSPGVTAGAAQDTRSVPYNELGPVEQLLRDEPVACVIVEPAAGNMGVVPPDEGFLQGLRRLCDGAGALLVFDEVMTGFRVARGGAQELYGVTPDLTTMGKVIGGGLPVGAYGGRRELMEQVAPAGEVYQAGTLSGNPLAMAAGLATLRLLDNGAYERLEAASARLERGLAEALKHRGVSGCVQRVGSMLTLFFTRGPVRNLKETKAADHDRFGALLRGMLARGVHLPPSGYEAWFLSLAHSDEAIGRTLEAFEGALSAL